MECKLATENNSGNNPTAWQINAQYSYVVNQKTFTGSRLSFGDNNSGSYEKQQQLCNRLSDGVAVHYQPENPSNAVLFIGGYNKYPPLDSSIILLCLVLLVAAAAIIGSIWYILKLLAVSRRITATNRTRPCLYNLCIVIGILLMMIYIGFISTCMLLFGGAFLGLIAWSVYRDRKSLSWPTTEGSILKCYIDKHVFGIYFWENEYRTAFEAKVEYSYTVNSEQFISTQISFYSYYYYRDNETPWSQREEERLQRCNEQEQRIYNKLKTASRVIVHYQPDNPSNAVLAVGRDKSIVDRINIV